MIKFPRHEGALHLSHNDHKNNYETVEQAIRTDSHGYEDDCWISPEERQRAIDTNECWTLQWYPDTPVGCHVLSASTLEALMAHVNGLEEGGG